MGEDKRCIDPELEKFLKENKDMIERLFKEEKDFLKGMFDEERELMEEFAEAQKNKAKDAAQGIMNMFTDPDVQRHFMAMGVEFIMGMNALMKAAPIPDNFRDMADKAEETRENAMTGFRKATADCNKKSRTSTSEKIEIKSVPKSSVKSSSNSKSSPSAEKKASD